MDPVVHFEMPYEDRDRAAKFYSAAFGWKPQMMGPDMADYVVMQTTETDEKGMIKEPGRINGGMFKKSGENAVPSVVISVADIHDAMKRVVSAGGRINPGQTNGEPVEIPNVGLYVGFTDTEGNKIALLEPKPMS